jgi:hypothetical protein
LALSVAQDGRYDMMSLRRKYHHATLPNTTR